MKLMKSFDEIANPHLQNKDTPTRRRAPKFNPNHPTIRKTDQTKCQVIPLLVHLFPELIEHNIKVEEHKINLCYTQILKQASELRKELLNLL